MGDWYQIETMKLEKERDSLLKELESSKKAHWACSVERTDLKAELSLYKRVLEYIELTGGNCGHDGANKGVPCPCGACMAEEAAKALTMPKEGGCTCGQPSTIGVHQTNAPCYYPPQAKEAK